MNKRRAQHSHDHHKNYDQTCSSHEVDIEAHESLATKTTKIQNTNMRTRTFGTTTDEIFKHINLAEFPYHILEQNGQNKYYPYGLFRGTIHTTAGSAASDTFTTVPIHTRLFATLQLFFRKSDSESRADNQRHFCSILATFKPSFFRETSIVFMIAQYHRTTSPSTDDFPIATSICSQL